MCSALGSSSVQLGFHSNFLTEALHPSSKRKKLAFRKFTLSCSSSPSSGMFVFLYWSFILSGYFVLLVFLLENLSGLELIGT